TARAFRAGGIALAARDVALDLQLLLNPVRRLFERDLKIVAEIGTALLARFLAPAAAEEFLETAAERAAEDLRENIRRIVESAASAAHAVGKGVVAVAVVRRA